MAIFQTVLSEDLAYMVWDGVVSDRNFCRMRRGHPYPDRSVAEVVEPVVAAEYPYLRSEVRPTVGYTVVLRGLLPGVYDIWLNTGPHVVGVKGALWKAYATCTEADAVFCRTVADRLVQMWTLLTPLEPRFLEL
ncbi:hypothetical protein BC835DRAFT_1303241 [Cytidiella melzeri]|nr:hypothetical protein BC835DRAFT_1303241 [Cytidiella melzeri]